MLGFIRLLLALAVAVSHTGLRIDGINPGVVAVIGFYLISGYVMSGLIGRHYSHPGTAPAFYLDRAARLLPQYVLYATLTLVWYLLARPLTPFLQHPPTPSDLINNLLIVPLNYYMWNGSDHFVLIPPAWSLGAEIQFYLLAPFLLTKPGRMLVVGALGTAVYVAALGGQIHSDWFGYRLLPGVLPFFLLGAMLQRLHASHRYATAWALALPTAAVSVLAMAILHRHGTLRQPYNLETLLGLALGVLVITALAARRRLPWDDFAGDLSYGVFLNHFLVLGVFFTTPPQLLQLPVYLVMCVTLSWATQRIVERPILGWQRRHRQTLTSF